MTAHSLLLGVLLVVYLVAMLAVGWWARGRIHDTEDYLVAGRRLSLGLAWPTLLATWFGAGTLLTATDEVRRGGLRMAALDPLGAGLCLLLAGWWLARPLWKMQLLTLGDYFRRRFGSRAEVVASLLMVPTYFGWIAAQFVALAGLLELFFGIPVVWGIAMVALVGTIYTMLGGMWSVTVTDVIQMTLIVLGLLILCTEALVMLGGGVFSGLRVLAERVSPDKLVVVPRDSAGAFVSWVGVLAVGSLGNLPGQDLLQRVFSSKSERVAVRACHLAGMSYLLLGMLPLGLGLAADVLVPRHEDQSTIGVLASLFLSPWSGSVLMLAVISAVFSTIDSALLSPASLLSENVVPKLVGGKVDRLALNRLCVLGIAVLAMLTAYSGESAYGLLEDAYALAMVSLLVPLLGGLWTRKPDERAALVSMLVGFVVWSCHWIAGWETFLAPWTAVSLPLGLTCTAVALVAFVASSLGLQEQVDHHFAHSNQDRE